MHFHLLGDCPDCYVKDSSFHKSFYRCVSIHGTNRSIISENVAYDVKGYCYYLEDGVEENNSIEFNLAAHIHNIGPDQPGRGSQSTDRVYVESPNLILPADVTASGYYITNVHNRVIGNAASGVSPLDADRAITSLCLIDKGLGWICFSHSRSRTTNFQRSPLPPFFRH